MSAPHLCSGCQVREPWEHRCFANDLKWAGEPPCECPEPDCVYRQRH